MQYAQRKTPGVYVTELTSFPPSAVGVETALPAFIGYTESAERRGQSVLNKPIRISSLVEYEQIFGTGGPINFSLTEASTPPGPGPAPVPTPGPTPGPAPTPDFTQGTGPDLKKYSLAPPMPRFYLYDSLRLFYANGGGNCYIVSIGKLDAKPDPKDFQNGLDAIGSEVGPTMLVAPDALLLDKSGYKNVLQQMIQQSHDLEDRVAILDLQGADVASADISDLTTTFRDAVQSGTSDDTKTSYGIAYFPWLRTSLYQPTDISFKSLDAKDFGLLATILKAEAKAVYGDNWDKTDGKDSALKASIDKLTDPTKVNDRLANDLMAALAILKQIFGIMADKLNVLPASGAMAGVYTQVDATRGVWNAPANISLNSVVGPTIKITEATQGDLNVPIEGKAINAIRDFVGRGTLVWGARTLDGNSNDFRYVQVRRTLIYVEQSIKLALNQFVFAPNVSQTWVAVTAMVSNFLQNLWSQGGLMGAKPAEAFTVLCGLGSTMTGQDVLDGYMRVQVTLQMVHPAEFIELTFKQQMQGV